MQPIAAEEIQDFDTSLDRLWARRDLVIVATGALICFRSIYQRALWIGTLGRFRYAAVREEDYVLGTAEEIIRDAVRDAAHLPGAQVVVIYLSCLDILTRPDFADIEHTLSAETGCIVRCFFRGPLAKADGIRHKTAEELLAALPPEDGAVTASAPLPPPMSDTAGVSDFLREEGAAHILVTPSGCRNALARMDLMPERSDVYALIPQAEDYIFGMEETAAAETGMLAAEGTYRTVHLLSSPVPAFMAMEAAPVLQAAEEQGCRACASPTDGFHDAVHGAAAASLRLVQEAANGWRESGRTVLILGYSPLLFGDMAQLDAPTAFLSAYGCDVRIAGRDALIERPALVWLVSAAGVSAAAWLHWEYDVPVVRSLPFGDAGRTAWQAEIAAVLGLPIEGACVEPTAGDVRADKILIIADPIVATATDHLLRAYGFCNIRCAAYAWDEETAALYRQAAAGADVLVFRTAAELQSTWDAADAVVADPALLSAMGEKRIVPLPSGLLSGRDAAGERSGVLGADFAAVLDAFLKG
ncbi:hypothetical protein [Selenomonas dianae]|uniref:Nitrogenase/oxidoreductase component 1 domain-containing protein n=1 Tax=Selenomonas dianae TaxID=135079 RepID=A0ABN0SV25_9FIRM